MNDTQIGFTPSQYPGVDGVANYTEGMFIGYRHWIAAKQEPAFWFGHGLSYSTFVWSNFSVTSANGTIIASCVVNNTSPVTGHDVVQVYLSFPERYAQPQRQLRGFQRVLVQGESTATVQIPIVPSRDLTLWQSGAPSLAHGTFTISFGENAHDVKKTLTFDF